MCGKSLSVPPPALCRMWTGGEEAPISPPLARAEWPPPPPPFAFMASLLPPPSTASAAAEVRRHKGNSHRYFF